MDSLLLSVDLGPLTNLSLPTALTSTVSLRSPLASVLLVSALDTARARARFFDTRLRTRALCRSAATDFHMRRLRLPCSCTE